MDMLGVSLILSLYFVLGWAAALSGLRLLRDVRHNSCNIMEHLLEEILRPNNEQNYSVVVEETSLYSESDREEFCDLAVHDSKNFKSRIYCHTNWLILGLIISDSGPSPSGPCG